MLIDSSVQPPFDHSGRETNLVGQSVVLFDKVNSVLDVVGIGLVSQVAAGRCPSGAAHVSSRLVLGDSEVADSS